MYIHDVVVNALYTVMVNFMDPLGWASMLRGLIKHFSGCFHEVV
jgi:hypothetical protein